MARSTTEHRIRIAGLAIGLKTERTHATPRAQIMEGIWNSRIPDGYPLPCKLAIKGPRFLLQQTQRIHPRIVARGDGESQTEESEEDELKVVYHSKNQRDPRRTLQAGGVTVTAAV
jgi:hypothetical protein